MHGRQLMRLRLATSALADSGVTGIDHPQTRVFGVLAFIISALETICRALADILRAPFLAEIVSGAAAKVVASAAMAAEVKADSLVKGASLLAKVTVEQIEKSAGDRKEPLTRSKTNQQMEFSSGENGDHRIASTTPSLTQHEMYGTRNSKSGILEKFGYVLEDVIGYGKFSVVKNSNYNLTFPTQPEVTSRCKDLIKKMLAPKNNRVDAETILCDPWLKNESAVLINSKNQELVRNIGAHYYQIIYPVQLRHHEKMGISTREIGAPKNVHSLNVMFMNWEESMCDDWNP
ncbi:SFRICE_034206 [Gryllus bimaculatus]|nr:SFRICE_034206 [Gryllus bimaculatus]